MSSSSSGPENIVKPYVHVGTLECATKYQCIPCMYKIYPTGRTTTPNQSNNYSDSSSMLQLPPNVRPEMCPRAKSIDSRLYHGLYVESPAKSRILTVGDGDLSFSLSIAKFYYDMYGSAKNITATTHESYHSVCKTYQDGKKHIDLLSKLGAHVYHEVDATNISQTLSTATDSSQMPIFNFIVWNFPCIRVEKGADGQVSELEQNRLLIRRFFANIQPYLVPHGSEVHVSHKTIEPFSWWGITDLAREQGFACMRTVVFDRCNYPGYVNRKVLDKKSFPCNDALSLLDGIGQVDVETEDREQQKEKPDKKQKKGLPDSEQIRIDGDIAHFSPAYLQTIVCLDDTEVRGQLRVAIAIKEQIARDSMRPSSGKFSSVNNSKASSSSLPLCHGSEVSDSFNKKRKIFDD